ncbi:MAG: hypothetical protein ABIF19_14355 [Planctomycetota bacterium]
MKKTGLTAAIVLVLVAIVVAGQTFAGWGGGRRAGRGPSVEQGGPAYPERQGPIMGRGGPGRGAPGPEWERGAPGPEWERGGPGRGRGPYAETPSPRGGGGRGYAVCPCCGAWLGLAPGGGDARDGFGPWRGQGPRVGRGGGPDQGFQQGVWGPRGRNMGRRGIAMRRRLMVDRWEQGIPGPYRGQGDFRRGDVQTLDRDRMDNWGPPQRRGMGGPGPGEFRPVRPEDGDRAVPPGPPRGRRWTPGGQPERPPQGGPGIDAPAETDGGGLGPPGAPEEGQ